MKKILFTILAVAITIGLMAQEKAQRPNIIVFLVDDMGWMDTSVPFSTELAPLNKIFRTPNMERLAKEGVKFTNAYATPVCTPTRVSMITGMNAAHHGVTNWTSPKGNTPTDAVDSEFLPADWNFNGWSNSPATPNAVYATTFPQLLKGAGYFTIHVGKAHWGLYGFPGASPYNVGFMVNIAGHSAGHPQSYYATENFGNLQKNVTVQAVPDLEEYYGTDIFLTDALTLEAIKAIQAPLKNKQPFYLNLSHYAVHAPIMGDKRFLQKYLDAGLDRVEASYAALIEGMDKSLGDIMDYLKTAKAEQNTIIIFMSDNGGLGLSPPRGGQAHTQNRPLKSGKGSVYEGGIREPMLVKWPGVAKAASVVNQPVIIEDFFPSILEMAGLQHYNTIQKIDGQSFVPFLRGRKVEKAERVLIWHYPNKWQATDYPGINYKSAIRKGDWKLIYNMRNGRKELYHLSTDIGEANNLADSRPETVKLLSELLSRQLRAWRSPMPTVKATGKPVALPNDVP
jgi:arylsulfatase A-like enzyme